jgi:hypothetical protein
LRVKGAIPVADVEVITSQVWDNLERRYPLRRNRPETWKAQRINGLHALDRSVTFAQIGNAKVCEMLDDVLGSGNWQPTVPWGSLLVAFPESTEQWDLPFGSWHLDFPASTSAEGLFVVRLFTCLLPLCHGGGATLFVAGSHLLVEDLIPKDTKRRLRSADIRKALIRNYSWIRALCSPYEGAYRIGRFMDSSSRVKRAELHVIEMTGEPGDLFLVHPFLLHAHSTNCANTPRMVLSSFVYRKGVDPTTLYQLQA